MTVTQSHCHGVDLPDGAERLAESGLFPNRAFR
jgi:GMP synthase-like glutamine amidotransferase